MIKKTIHLILVIAVAVSFWVCFDTLSAAAADPSLSPFQDVENFGPLRRLMVWSPRQKLAGFRNINKLYPTRKVERGDHVYPLCQEPIDLSGVRYEVNGKTYTFNDFISHNKVVGFLVIKNDRIVAERYEMGNTDTARWIAFSVTKSVVPLLVGAAIHDGFIKSIDDKLTDYIPQLKGSAYDAVSIRNLLQMASGVEWNEDYMDPKSDVNTMPMSDMVKFYEFLSKKKRVAKPGEKFNYNTAETSLAGAVVRAAIGNNLSTYLSNKIWEPFGMESDGYWWLQGPGGGEIAGMGLNVTLRDFGRLGLFALNEGKLANGVRVLPENWMKESTTPSKGYPGYGYFWWLGMNGKKNVYSARGIFGQLIYIDPDQNLVIATQSIWDYPVSDLFESHRNAFVTAVDDYLRTHGPKN